MHDMQLMFNLDKVHMILDEMVWSAGFVLLLSGC
jgi:hypothetical protein